MKIPFSFLIGKKLRKQSASIIAVLGIILILSGEHLRPSLHFIYLGAALIAWSVANDVTWRGLRYISKGRTPAVMMSYLTCAYGVACVVKAGDPVFWRPMARWTWPIVLFSGLFGIFEIVAVMLARYRAARDGGFPFKPESEELIGIVILLTVTIFTMMLCAGLNADMLPVTMTADAVAMLLSIGLYAMGLCQSPEIIMVKKS